MTPERHKLLMDSPIVNLTAEERKTWHFCWDWDGLLIEKGSPEFDCCVCAGGDSIRKP